MVRCLPATTSILFICSLIVSCTDCVCPSSRNGVFQVDSLYPSFIVERDNGTIYSRMRCRYVYHFENRPGNILHVHVSVGLPAYRMDTRVNITTLGVPKPVDVMFDDSRGYGADMDYSYLDHVDMVVWFEGLFWDWKGDGRDFEDRKFYGPFSWRDTIRVAVENRL